ncbi:MAG: 2-dehydropantoate 2-reductase N-terminal domain-containing protein [Pseudomonadota bacterium]
MKTLIVGMGNIGIIHGWALSQGGADVTHVVRKGTSARHSSITRMDILDLRGESPQNYKSSYQAKIIESPVPEDNYRLVLVPTNHLQAVDAVRQYVNLSPDADFLIFTANWEGTGAFDKLLPPSRYLWGFSVSTGARNREGLLFANIQKQYRIGELDGSITHRLETISHLFAKARMTADIKSNIIEWQWVHHAINAGIIGTALFSGKLPDENDSIEVWLLMYRAVRDALAVLRKRGIDVWSYSDAKPFVEEGSETTAERLRQSFLAMPHYQRIRGCSHLDSSLEEMKRFYLDVLETGERLEVSMPHLGSMKERICGFGKR